jgi:hypothetical protein
MQQASALANWRATNHAYTEIYKEIGEYIRSEEAFTDETLDTLTKNVIKDSDIVIGMKGIITHTLGLARVRNGVKTRLVNWITNSGLAALNIHQTTHADLHVTPMRSDVRVIRAWDSADHKKVYVAGPPISLRRPSVRPVTSLVQHAAIIVYLNYAALPHVRACNEIALLYPSAAIFVFVSSRSDNLASIEELNAESACNINYSATADQQCFLKALNIAASSKAKLLISKSGPNTMFEAISIGLPILVYKSGIPQEDWVCSFIEGKGIGSYCSSLREAISEIKHLITPENQKRMIGNQQVVYQQIALTAEEKARMLAEVLGLGEQ